MKAASGSSSIALLAILIFAVSDVLHEAEASPADRPSVIFILADDRYEPKDQGFDVDFPHVPTAAGPSGDYLAPWKFITDEAISGRPGDR